MRILILNWRCPRNPRAGGAEILTYEVAKRLVESGDTVEWFAAGYPGCATREELSGIRIIRSGSQATVHAHAIRHYRGDLRGQFDVVLDEINTIPFFTPIWAKIPAFAVIFQLAREVWWYESRFPLSGIGYLIEPLYLQCYRRTPVLTISRSTERDLRRMGFSSRIAVVPVGIQPIGMTSATTREAEPTFLYVGRLTPSKRVGHLIRALRGFRDATGTGQLWIVGEGDESHRRSLVRLADRLGLASHVQFWGWLPSNAKHRLMAKAHAVVMASAREGWGLVVTEANACGTPAVVYDVGGLRDSVRNGETGFVVEPRPEKLAKGMISLVEDSRMYERIASAARDWSTSFSFERAAQAVRGQITDALGNPSSHETNVA